MSDGGFIPGSPVPAYLHPGERRISRTDAPPLLDAWRRPQFVQPPPMPDTDDDPEEHT